MRALLVRASAASRHKELWRRVAHHALWIGAILAHIDFLDEQIDRLSAQTRSRSRSAPSRGRLNCCARSPASSTAARNASWPDIGTIICAIWHMLLTGAL